MANNRSAIRAATKALLLSATSAEGNVFTSYKSKLWQTQLPAILIHTSAEQANLESIQSRRYIRTLELKIDVKIQSTESAADDLDLVVAQVEAIIAANPYLSGTVLSTIQTHTDLVVDANAENDVAAATLTFECKYIS